MTCCCVLHVLAMSLLIDIVLRIDFIDLAIFAHIADVMPWPVVAVFLTIGLFQNIGKKYMQYP